MRSASLIQLASRIDSQLTELAEIPLCDSDSGCGYGYAPTLHIYGKTDPALHKLPNSGQAKVTYKLKRKTVDIRDNGEERYGAEIAIEGIEAVELSEIVDKYAGHDFQEDPEAPKRKIDAVDVVRGGMATTGGLIMAHTLIGKKGMRGLKRQGRKLIGKDQPLPAAGARDRFLASPNRAKGVNLESILERYDFADRARDTGGRYAPGQNVSVDEMADAYVKPGRKKKAALVAGAGAGLATAAILGRKQVAPRLGQAVARMALR
jgi:hypothetical protein